MSKPGYDQGYEDFTNDRPALIVEDRRGNYVCGLGNPPAREWCEGYIEGYIAAYHDHDGDVPMDRREQLRAH